MTTAPPSAAKPIAGPSLRTRVAAAAVILALAALAAYGLFAGPTMVPAPPTTTETVPQKAATQAPAGGEPGESERGDGR